MKTEKSLLSKGEIKKEEFSLFEISKFFAPEKKYLKHEIHFKKAIDTNTGELYPAGILPVKPIFKISQEYQGNCLMEKAKSKYKSKRTILAGNHIFLNSNLIITDLKGDSFQLKSPSGLLALNAKINIH